MWRCLIQYGGMKMGGSHKKFRPKITSLSSDAAQKLRKGDIHFTRWCRVICYKQNVCKHHPAKCNDFLLYNVDLVPKIVSVSSALTRRWNKSSFATILKPLVILKGGSAVVRLLDTITTWLFLIAMI